MNKRLYTLCAICWLVSTVWAQDFVSLFMEQYPNDTIINCITISPRMMEEIYKSDSEKDQNMLEVISGLKSMQILISATDGDLYYDKARDVLNKNPGRYESFVSSNNRDADFQVLVRKKKDAVIEMIMMKLLDDNRFFIINFTGDIKTEFIMALGESFSQEQILK